jgi:hypothetical protein
MDQSREAHHTARPLHSPEGAKSRTTAGLAVTPGSRGLLRTLRVATLTLQGQRPQGEVLVRGQVVGRGPLTPERCANRKPRQVTSERQGRSIRGVAAGGLLLGRSDPWLSQHRYR